MNIIEQLDQEQIAHLTGDKKAPTFAPGDTIRVNVRVVEGVSPLRAPRFVINRQVLLRGLPLPVAHSRNFLRRRPADQ